MNENMFRTVTSIPCRNRYSTHIDCCSGGGSLLATTAPAVHGLCSMTTPAPLDRKPLCELIVQWQAFERYEMVTRYSGADGKVYECCGKNWFTIGPDGALTTRRRGLKATSARSKSANSSPNTRRKQIVKLISLADRSLAKIREPSAAVLRACEYLNQVKKSFRGVQ